jgi:hypothetical protein
MEIVMSPTLPPQPAPAAAGPIWLTGRLRRAQPDYPRVARVLAYWEGLRAGRIAPTRTEIDPAGIAEHLEVMFVAEVVAPGIARFRLAGQHLATLAGMEPRGMPLSCLFEAPARDGLAQAVAQVGMGARVILPLRADRGIGRPGLEGRLALLPLSDADGRITRILGALETCGQPGRPPRRFRLTGPAEGAVSVAALPQPQATPEARRAAFRLIPGGA